MLKLECLQTVIVRMPATKSHRELSLRNVVSLCLPDILKCMEALSPLTPGLGTFVNINKRTLSLSLSHTHTHTHTLKYEGMWTMTVI